MGEAGKEKDIWDKLAALTPLILGLAITGVGGFFTQVYNYHQLQLNQIEALDKLRPLLTSEKPEEREFGYASFAALGYEKIAIRMIGLKKDQSGRSVLLQLKTSGSPEVQASASNALKSLDAEQKLVNIAEFGKAVPDAAFLKQHPEEAKFAAGSPEIETWAKNAAHDVGISSKLGVAVLYDTAFQSGLRQAHNYVDAASKIIAPPLDTPVKEAAWLNAYLDTRDSYMQEHLPQFYSGLKIRTDRLRGLIKAGDWDLKSIDQASVNDPAGP
jgi:Glycosyl hydrolase family 46